ncbi:uncharacterized protein LOC132936603 [Metopolophium dirhodum]|uniref:uncharacterized protein LOC132936603 n=1 Tax=Metopolophium dirhodum TaxID=44670 RepID=UPI0029901C8D|nr:uncharacterized protein LOC132936603 [Metopolophium dirhodum]
MGSKLNSEKKNKIGNHGEHSTWFDTKTVVQRNNEYNFMKECSVNFASPIIMKRLKKYARKLPETKEEFTFGLNQRYPKRRKVEHYQEILLKNNFIGPFNSEHQTIISVKDFRTLKFKPERYKTKNYKTSLLFPKLNPEIVLDFIKQPSVNKLMKLLDLMYTESIHYHKHSIDLTDREQSRRIISIELKKYLFELCYQKFCELWLQKTPNISVLSTKQLKRFIRSLLRHTRCKTTICTMNLKKLILYNGGLTGYPKKPHLVLCINIICSVFTTLLRKSSRMLTKENKKKVNSKKYNKDEKQSIKLYKKGTTKKKSFLDIVNEYKHIMKTDRLSFYQVADIKHAYEGILEPGQYITKEDLDTCANENYKFNINDHISFDENNDDFIFDDIEITSDSELPFFENFPAPKLENCFQEIKFEHSLREYVKDVQPNNSFGLKYDKKNGSIEAIEREVHIQSTSKEDPYINMEISSNVLERTTATNYSGAETSSENLGLERPTNTLVKKRNSSSNYSKICERFIYKLLSDPITLTKSEKRMLRTIIFADMNPYKVKWKRRKSSEKSRLFQFIVYFGSLKMGLCDKLHLDLLDLKGKYICDMIDIEKLLKSIQIESCVLEEYFSFTEVDNFLIWPLGKMIVNNIISQSSPTINILFSFVKKIVNSVCKRVKDFCRNSGLRIVLNKESLFENLSDVRIVKDVLTELSLKYANIHTYPLPVDNDEFSNNTPGTSNSEHFCVTNTGFCIKKNSSNEEICKSMVNILKSDDSIHQSWKECNNARRFISKLLKAGVTLPIKESNTGHGSKFVEVYVRWFCEEYLEDDKFYKLAVSILKNIFFYIDTASGFTDINIEDAINNALMILYDQPCFAKAYESYLNTKYPKCLSSSKHDSTNDTENHSDYKGVNIRAIEELQIEPNVQTDPIDTNNVDMSHVPSNIPTSNEFNVLNNVTFKNSVTPDLQSTNYDINNLIDTNNVDMSLVPSNITISNVFDVFNNVTMKNSVTPDLQSTNYDINNPIDTNNVDMSLVPSNIPTSNVFDVLNNVTIKNSVTPDLQSINYDINSDFLLQNLINENTNNLMENIGVIDDGINIFNNPDTVMMDIDDPSYNNIPGFNEFNEDSPFDDAIPTTVMSLDYNLSNGILESGNLEFQQTKNMEEIAQVPINSVDSFIIFGEKEEETNLQLQQAKNMEEVSMISSDQLVYFDQSDEINLNELMETDIDNYGFYNAGVLLPP